MCKNVDRCIFLRVLHVIIVTSMSRSTDICNTESVSGKECHFNKKKRKETLEKWTVIHIQTFSCEIPVIQKT